MKYSYILPGTATAVVSALYYERMMGVSNFDDGAKKNRDPFRNRCISQHPTDRDNFFFLKKQLQHPTLVQVPKKKRCCPLFADARKVDVSCECRAAGVSTGSLMLDFSFTTAVVPAVVLLYFLHTEYALCDRRRRSYCCLPGTRYTSTFV